MTALPRIDLLEAKDRNARGQGPRTQAQVLSKKKVFKTFFQAISKKKVFKKFFQAINKIFTIKKYCCHRAEDRAIFEDLRPRTSKCVREDSTSAYNILVDNIARLSLLLIGMTC